MKHIWTDGSCEPNPGPGGWGWHDGKGEEHCGGAKQTTNNRMEMTAILDALKAQADGAQVTIYSDSQYCVKGLTVWRPSWKRRNWRKKGADMPNRDLWLALEDQISRVQARFKWVRGHSGDRNNERADELAKRGRLHGDLREPESTPSAEALLSDLLNEGGVDTDSLAPWQWDAMTEMMGDFLRRRNG